MSGFECMAYIKLSEASEELARNQPLRPIGAVVIVAVAMSLIGVNSGVQAQQAPQPLIGDHFVTVGGYHINLGQIRYVEQEQRSNHELQVALHFKGVHESLVLKGEEAKAFLAAAFGTAGTDRAAKRGVKLEAEAAGDTFAFQALDSFDGKFGLNWKPVRPDPSHVSLTKTPGALTISTQLGSIHREETDVALGGGGIQAKNLYLIDNPLAHGGDFVATTCVSGFTPETHWQQAGLIVYNDDDNYLKFGYEYNLPNGGGQAFCILIETDAKSGFHYLDNAHSGLKRYWVRLTKRGNRYEYASSSDGKSFTVHGEVEWGDGSPKQVGLLAKNGGNKDAGELDAAFEFFELRAPAPAPSQPVGAGLKP
jgi:regulation of enolase protein 1 (concanavalin A-like superfamily)